jgi:dipeptidyl-peptidase-4
MLNTDLCIPFIPVEYLGGQMPSPFRIGVVQINNAQTSWMKIPTDLKNGTYLPRMEWAANSQELITRRLNRNQNQSDVLICDAKTGNTSVIYSEKNPSWIDVFLDLNYYFKWG